MHVKDVLACSMPDWYPMFEKVTIRTEIVPLPHDVLEYLLDDGKLILPKECNKELSDGVEGDYDDFGDVDWNVDQPTDSPEEQKSFPEFSAQVTSVLNTFGGQMFCKLNWSSPQDASWIDLNKSLKCTSLSQMYLLLKSSDFIAHDLTMPFKYCDDFETEKPKVQYCLALRKWIDVNPGIEYRCFVKNNELIAISQRDDSTFYEHIKKSESSIKQDIITFFREHIQHKFTSINFVFDVLRTKKDKVILIDFNPFCETTNALFFTWEELNSWSTKNNTEDKHRFEFRYATDSSGVQPHPYRHYTIPSDFVDLSTGSDPAKLMDFLKLQTKASAAGARVNVGSESDSD
jgi:hypothetical protein